MCGILSVIFFVCGLFACGNFYKLICLLAISGLFAIADAVYNIVDTGINTKVSIIEDKTQK
jgi:hypothetical protein